MQNARASSHSIDVQPLRCEKRGNDAFLWPHYIVFVFSISKVYALSYTLPETCRYCKHMGITTKATGVSVQSPNTLVGPRLSAPAYGTQVLLTWTCFVGVICVAAFELIPLCTLFVYMSGPLILDPVFLVRLVATVSSMFGVVAISRAFPLFRAV